MIEQKFKNILKLKSRINEIINKEESEKQVLIYQEHVVFPKYKITVEIIEQNSFIDAKGRKWIKAKDE